MRNIFLAYLITICRYSWFWLGIWVLYYLKFTDYTGVGLIETVVFLTFMLVEIPTGAIADLLGKKWTLVMAFIIQVIGSIIMGFAPNYAVLLISVFFLAAGSSFYSGTFEALVYDTLKEHKKENDYAKIIAHVSSLQLIVPAVCGIIGGYMYTLDPRWPILANGSFYVIGAILSLFLSEPHIDSTIFSFSSFLTQTKQGFAQLFKNAQTIQNMILLLSISVIVVVAFEMLDNILSIEYGFRDENLGIVWAIIFVVSAGASQLTPSLIKKIGERSVLVLMGIGIAITLLVSPLLGMTVGAIILLIRSCFVTIFNNVSSVLINDSTESKYRATTLSTFTMIKNVPYALSAVLIGSLANIYSAKKVAFYLGFFLVIFLLVQLLSRSRKKR